MKRTDEDGASEIVIERIVKPISREPLSAASYTPSPRSMCRTDVLQHDDRVVDDESDAQSGAIRDMLSMLYP